MTHVNTLTRVSGHGQAGVTSDSVSDSETEERKREKDDEVLGLVVGVTISP